MNADYRLSVTPIKRVAIVGPECTGKTSLAVSLASHLQTHCVPEFARQYLEALERPYTKSDLLTIAQGQVRLEDELAHTANNILICDTNLLVVKIWSEFKYGMCDPWILEEIDKRNYDLHLLTNIDVPWQADEQREHPHQREELFLLYKHELISRQIPFVEISGVDAAREQVSIRAIDKLLMNEHN